MLPKQSGLALARLHFKDDITTAFSLALVTLPLAVGIALAADAPPMAGVIAAIVGGIIATPFRGSQLTINGAAAGLIVVIASGISSLGGGDALLGFRYVLAATVIAGFFQLLIGLLKWGKIGDMFPVAVIHGMLIAIGLMIIGAEIHVAFGVHFSSDSALMNLAEIPDSFMIQNPLASIIAFGTIAILLLHSFGKSKWLRFFPAPILVLLWAIPWAFYFDFFTAHDISLLGGEYAVSPDLLVNIPSEIQESIIFPDFGKIGDLSFWSVVASITLISYIETLVSIKVVDRIDPDKRQTNMNKDLIGVGLATMVSGAIGGLPIITAIPMYNGAKTKWTNLYHGLILLSFILLLYSVIQLIPLAALAALLVYTGYRLAAPKNFKIAFIRGDEQFMIVIATLVAVLLKGVLFGALVGVIAALWLHYAKAGLNLKDFARMLLRPNMLVNKNEVSKEVYIKTEGVVNFVNILSLKKHIKGARGEEHVVLDMSDTRLIDYTVLEYLNEQVERYDLPESKFELIGLDAHETTSRHPNAVHVLRDDKRPQLSKRQLELEVLVTQEHGGQFWPEIRWDTGQFDGFNLFRGRNIEYKLNTAKGNYKMFFEWETCDIAFGEGAFFSSQERYTSVAFLYLPFDSPSFTMTREGMLDKVSTGLGIQTDINFKTHPFFSSRFLLQGRDEKAIRDFFSEDLLQFLENNKSYNMESNGKVLLIFKQFRVATPTDMREMHKFNDGLAKILLGVLRKQTLDIKNFTL